MHITFEVIYMHSYANREGIPLSFGTALMQNSAAAAKFASLTDAQKHAVVSGAMEVSSGREMQAYVKSIAGRDFYDCI